jgi:hypothetical protein
LVLDRLAEWIEWRAWAVNHGCGLSCYAAAARPEYRKKLRRFMLGLPYTGDRMGSSLRLGSDQSTWLTRAEVAVGSKSAPNRGRRRVWFLYGGIREKLAAGIT